jgi:predicted DNA-binding transcriptional regulator YafY
MARGKQSDAQTQLRLTTLLTIIPRGHRNAKTVAQLGDILEAKRVERTYAWASITRRTLERDLAELAAAHEGLCRDEESRPQCWYWAADAAAPAGVAMTAAQALALSMAQEHLRQLLPESNAAELEPLFLAARKALAASRKHAGWSEKVRVAGLGFHAAPPVILSGVQQQVTEALLMDRRCHVTYRGAGASDDKEYDVHPLGLVVRNGAVTLVCTKVETDRDERGPIQLQLHRMKSAKRLEEMRRVPSGFKLAEFDVGGGEGVTALRGSKAMQIKLLVHPNAPFWPQERALPKQQIGTWPDGRMVVEAKVPNSKEFLAWLRGFGPSLEVLEPIELRDQLADEARQIVERCGRT